MAEFEKEEVPDGDTLFMRIHRMWVRDGDLNPGTFRNHGDGMSTDWSKYSDPAQTKNRVVNYDKDPDNYGVLSMNVEKVRQIPDQIVVHKPLDDNRSHTDVEGVKKTKQRVLYLEIVNWEITLPELD